MSHRRLFKCAFALTFLVVVATVLFALTVPTPISEKDAFLHGLFAIQRDPTRLGRNHQTVIARRIANPRNPNDPDILAGTAYYNLVDPNHLRGTLADWKAANGFGSLPAVNARYANRADLGFGRDTECVKNPATGDVACSMGNYLAATFDGTKCTLNFNANVVDSATAAATRDFHQHFANVNMEFSPIEGSGSTKVVKFFVYTPPADFCDPNRTVAPQDSDFKITVAADLDGNGARANPGLCIVCHGGEFKQSTTVDANGAPGLPVFNSVADVEFGSQFLVWDMGSLVFSNVAGFTKADEQVAIAESNVNIVLATGSPAVDGGPTGPTAAIQHMIQQMYPGLFPPGNGVIGPYIEQRETFLVDGWNVSKGTVPGATATDTRVVTRMYRNVVARTCRTCHSANPVGVASSVVNGIATAALQFDRAADLIGTSTVAGNLGSIEALVCSANVMPHAKKTFLSDQYPSSFWASKSTAPGDLQAFGNRFGNFATNGWLGNQCTLPSPPPDPYLHPNTTQINIEQVFQKKCAWCHYNPVNPDGFNFQQGQQNRALLTGFAPFIYDFVASRYMPLGCVGDYCLSNEEVRAVQDWSTSGGGFKP